jgi:hypothetical protein
MPSFGDLHQHRRSEDSDRYRDLGGGRHPVAAGAAARSDRPHCRRAKPGRAWIERCVRSRRLAGRRRGRRSDAGGTTCGVGPDTGSVRPGCPSFLKDCLSVTEGNGWAPKRGFGAPLQGRRAGHGGTRHQLRVAEGLVCSRCRLVVCRQFVFAHVLLAEAALSVLREHEELLTEAHR